jgi:beta-galactosidase
MRTGFAQTFSAETPDILLRLLGTDEACGFDITVGAGRAVVLTTSLDADPFLWKKVYARLGVEPALAHGAPANGIAMTSTRTPDGQRLLHLLNLDGFAKVIRPAEHGRPLFGGRELRLGPRAGLMLPLGVWVGPGKVVWATTEIAGSDADSVTFRVTQPEEVVVIESEREILASTDYTVETVDGQAVVTSRRFEGWTEEELTVRFGPHRGRNP